MTKFSGIIQQFDYLTPNFQRSSPDWTVPSGNQFFEMQYVLPKASRAKGSRRVSFVGSTLAPTTGAKALLAKNTFGTASTFTSGTTAKLPPPPVTLHQNADIGSPYHDTDGCAIDHSAPDSDGPPHDPYPRHSHAKQQ
ncbi:Aste57867_8820 [Aphanomyces stellatus]|uniref:Aste57867_8820 protein n=1 Tax=Aphanomyces stellatus TaxID=120398 RepID=A0A485KL90_9STRA|nr:hypothetical protein As57867_008785 [Aphanomyces stellatus]VFT85706.1 Aste57867_8820 [Aphanomyces stellatus]